MVRNNHRQNCPKELRIIGVEQTLSLSRHSTEIERDPLKAMQNGEWVWEGGGSRNWTAARQKFRNCFQQIDDELSFFLNRKESRNFYFLDNSFENNFTILLSWNFYLHICRTRFFLINSHIISYIFFLLHFFKIGVLICILCLSVCLFGYSIITHKPLDRFVSNYDWGTRKNQRNFLYRWNSLQMTAHFSRCKCVPWF